MMIYSCDNPNCNRKLTERDVTHVEITLDNKKRRYDLCKNCLEVINDSLNTLTDKRSESEKLNELNKNNSKIEEYGVDNIINEFKYSSITVKQLANKVGVPYTKVFELLTEAKVPLEKDIRTYSNVEAQVDLYGGYTKLKEVYLYSNKSLTQIAKEVGISEAALRIYTKKTGISNGVRRELRRKEAKELRNGSVTNKKIIKAEDKREEIISTLEMWDREREIQEKQRERKKRKLDFEKLTRKTKKKLVEFEESTSNCKQDCFNCAYRNRDINYCWYKVVTDKDNKRPSVDECKHYIPLEKLDSLNE